MEVIEIPKWDGESAGPAWTNTFDTKDKEGTPAYFV